MFDRDRKELEKERFNDKVLNVMYNILFDTEIISEEYDNIEDVKKDFIIHEYLLNNEFTINFPFGNINMEVINQLNSRFNAEGFNLYTISDCETRKNCKGLIFYFKKKGE